MTSPSEGKPQYRLFREVEFCSNRLVEVPVLIMVDEVPMLRLAYGQVPLVWLQVPIRARGEAWGDAVTESRARHPSVIVETDPAASTVRVNFGGKEMLRVVTVS